MHFMIAICLGISVKIKLWHRIFLLLAILQKPYWFATIAWDYIAPKGNPKGGLFASNLDKNGEQLLVGAFAVFFGLGQLDQPHSLLILNPPSR